MKLLLSLLLLLSSVGLDASQATRTKCICQRSYGYIHEYNPNDSVPIHIKNRTISIRCDYMDKLMRFTIWDRAQEGLAQIMQEVDEQYHLTPEEKEEFRKKFVNIQHKNGDTFLAAAVGFGYINSTIYLLRCQASAQQGFPLSYIFHNKPHVPYVDRACMEKDTLPFVNGDVKIKLATILVGYGAEINQLDKSGKTLLIYCLQHHFSIQLLQRLLELGADPHIRTKKNKSAFDFTDKAEHRALLEKADELRHAWNNGGAAAAYDELRKVYAAQNAQENGTNNQQNNSNSSSSQNAHSHKRQAPAISTHESNKRQKTVTAYDILNVAEDASSGQILGLEESPATLDLAKERFFTLSRTWHPDKIADSSEAQARYELFKEHIAQLSQDDQRILKSRVFDLIKNAYEEIRKDIADRQNLPIF